MKNCLPKQYKPVIGQESDCTFILGELRTRDNRNSRKRRRDNIDFRYTVILDKKTYNKLKTEK